MDTTVPHSARVLDFWLGGADHFEADRQAGRRMLAEYPRLPELVRAARDFTGRVVRHLVVEEGVRQFLDVGTGLPTEGSTHEVAQRFAPGARVVYVDSDPLVLAHAGRLLTCAPRGTCAYLHADAHDPDRILAEASRTLDLDQPVGVLLMGLLGHVRRHTEARAVVQRLMQDLPAGSCLAVRDGADTDEALSAAVRHYSESGALPYRLRTPEEIAHYFTGLEMIEPGVVPVTQWRPQPPPAADAAAAADAAGGAPAPGSKSAGVGDGQPPVLGGVARRPR